MGIHDKRNRDFVVTPKSNIDYFLNNKSLKMIFGGNITAILAE